jgi:uncharacterized spore protein YtfJ
LEITKGDPMSASEVLRENFERMRESFNVKTAYGEPREAHGRTIIPVARVGYGFGAGFGSGGKNKDDKATYAEEGEGGGGGGGGAVIPVGVVEISAEGTRFIPIRDWRRIAKTAIGGIFMGLMLARKLRKKG